MPTINPPIYPDFLADERNVHAAAIQSLKPITRDWALAYIYMSLTGRRRPTPAPTHGFQGRGARAIARADAAEAESQKILNTFVRKGLVIELPDGMVQKTIVSQGARYHVPTGEITDDMDGVPQSEAAEYTARQREIVKRQDPKVRELRLLKARLSALEAS